MGAQAPLLELLMESKDGKVYKKPKSSGTSKQEYADDGRSGARGPVESSAKASPKKRESRHPSADKRVIFSISPEQLKDVRGF